MRGTCSELLESWCSQHAYVHDNVHDGPYQQRGKQSAVQAKQLSCCQRDCDCSLLRLKQRLRVIIGAQLCCGAYCLAHVTNDRANAIAGRANTKMLVHRGIERAPSLERCDTMARKRWRRRWRREWGT